MKVSKKFNKFSPLLTRSQREKLGKTLVAKTKNDNNKKVSVSGSTNENDINVLDTKPSPKKSNASMSKKIATKKSIKNKVESPPNVTSSDKETKKKNNERTVSSKKRKKMSTNHQRSIRRKGKFPKIIPKLIPSYYKNR